MPEHPFIAPAYDMEDDPFDIVEILRIKKERELKISNPSWTKQVKNQQI